MEVSVFVLKYDGKTTFLQILGTALDIKIYVSQ